MTSKLEFAVSSNESYVVQGDVGSAVAVSSAFLEKNEGIATTEAVTPKVVARRFPENLECFNLSCKIRISGKPAVLYCEGKPWLYYCRLCGHKLKTALGNTNE